MVAFVAFVECDVPSIQYRNSTYVNVAVNLGLCKGLSKERVAWYPDNTGKPSIVFRGCNIEWAFNTEEERDAQFDKLIAKQYLAE